MQKILSIIAITGALTILLTGCAPQDPTLAPGVKRQDTGLYSVSEMNVILGDPIAQAVQQCRMDGNKKLDIVSNTTQNGLYSGTTYAVIVFRCKK